MIDVGTPVQFHDGVRRAGDARAGMEVLHDDVGTIVNVTHARVTNGVRLATEHGYGITCDPRTLLMTSLGWVEARHARGRAMTMMPFHVRTQGIPENGGVPDVDSPMAFHDDAIVECVGAMRRSESVGQRAIALDVCDPGWAHLAMLAMGIRARVDGTHVVVDQPWAARWVELAGTINSAHGEHLLQGAHLHEPDLSTRLQDRIAELTNQQGFDRPFAARPEQLSIIQGILSLALVGEMRASDASDLLAVVALTPARDVLLRNMLTYHLRRATIPGFVSTCTRVGRAPRGMRGVRILGADHVAGGFVVRGA